MTYDDTALHLAATGPDEEALSHVRHVIAVHLERFAAPKDSGSSGTVLDQPHAGKRGHRPGQQIVPAVSWERPSA